jgi:ribonuclease R
MARPLPTRAEIIRCLEEAGRPLHSREVATRLGVVEASFLRLSELLEQLCFEGTIQRLGGHRFLVRADAKLRESWEGMLSMNPRGFGFVNAVGHDDVFIPPDAVAGALHGDKVVVTVVNRSSRGIEGRIQHVVARRSPRIAGTLRKRGRHTWLEPDDTRLRGPILLPETRLEKRRQEEEDAGGAEPAKSDDPGSNVVTGRDGDAAIVELMRFPELADETLVARLVAVLGAPGDPNTEVSKILLREQIVEEHPADAMQEAETMAARLQRLPAESRRDLRHVPLPTIDPKDARDHDDAVWVEKRGEGFRAYVAIADVSEYVVEGCALDAEALARGCTIYLPDRAIPMLPSALAADLCSLLPDRDRLCMAVIADIDRHGRVESFEVVEGIMCSSAMLTYEGVATALGFTDKGPRSLQAEAMRPGLRHLDDLSRRLRKARLGRGALDMDLPEAHVILDPETGRPSDVVRRAKDPGVKRAYQMIEELMLLANELVAQWLSAQKSVAIYRIHATPDPEKLERVARIAKKLGFELDPADLAEPKGLGRWLRSIADHPKKNVLEMLTLRALKQAAYDIVNVGHFGLASDAYLHFTSPIRRYPDLVVHRLVKQLLRGGKLKSTPEEVEAVRSAATQSSQRERASVEVEREVVDLYRVIYMQDHVGEQFEGVVTGVTGSGVYVALDDPYVDALVRFEQLGAEEYELSDDELAVVGVRSGDRVEMGQRLTVVVEEASITRRMTFGRRVNVTEPGRRASGTALRKSLERTAGSSGRHARPGVSDGKPGLDRRASSGGNRKATTRAGRDDGRERARTEAGSRKTKASSPTKGPQKGERPTPRGGKKRLLKKRK